MARDALAGAPVLVAAAIDFPLGLSSTPSRVYQALAAADAGADELDVVVRLPLALSGRWRELREDLHAVVTATPRCAHKVIIETGLLDAGRMKRAARAVVAAGAACVKT